MSTLFKVHLTLQPYSALRLLVKHKNWVYFESLIITHWAQLQK